MAIAAIMLSYIVTSSASPRHRHTAAECRQMQRSVNSFTQRYMRGRLHQKVHCQEGYVTFLAHREGENVVCSAPIRRFQKQQWIAMATKDCVTLSLYQKQPLKQPSRGSLPS